MKKINRFQLRDIILFALMVGSVVLVISNPIKKEGLGTKINLGTYIPESFNGWVGNTFDTSDYTDKWQSINELLVRTYTKGVPAENARSKTLMMVLEYSSDLRKNFSLHFPEGCHRAAGNELEFFPAIDIQLAPGKSIKAKCLFIKGKKDSPEDIDKIVVYWLVIDEKQFYQTFFIKLDQMMAGLIRKPKRGFLIRFDYYDNLVYQKEHLEFGQDVIVEFIKDLYAQLDNEKRNMMFGQ